MIESIDSILERVAAGVYSHEKARSLINEHVALAVEEGRASFVKNLNDAGPGSLRAAVESALAKIKQSRQ